MKEKIKKYLPDILIIGGILILSYNVLSPVKDPLTIDLIDYHTEEKLLGIFLIAIGIDIAIRRYLKK